MEKAGKDFASTPKWKMKRRWFVPVSAIAAGIVLAEATELSGTMFAVLAVCCYAVYFMIPTTK